MIQFCYLRVQYIKTSVPLKLSPVVCCYGWQAKDGHGMRHICIS